MQNGPVRSREDVPPRLPLELRGEGDYGGRTLQQVRTLGTASSGMWSNMGGCMLKNCRHTYSPWRPA